MELASREQHINHKIIGLIDHLASPRVYMWPPGTKPKLLLPENNDTLREIEHFKLEDHLSSIIEKQEKRVQEVKRIKDSE